MDSSEDYDLRSAHDQGNLQPVIGQYRRRNNFLRGLLRLLIIVILLAAAGGGGYLYKQSKDKTLENDQTTQIASLQQQITSLNKQLKSGKSSTGSTTSISTSSTDGCSQIYVTSAGQKYLVVNQFDLEIPLSSTISDLCYVWHPASGQNSAVADIDSSSLYTYASSQDPACKINNTSGNDNGTIPFYQIGQIVESPKTTGTPPATASEDLGAYVNLNGNQYRYYTPQDSCSSMQSVSSEVSSYISAFEAALPKATVY